MTASDRAGLWLPTAATDDAYVGPYRIVREAGSGGMGVVYLAADVDERPVALKVLREHIADDPQARTRLRRELELMRRVRDRNIADVIDADLEAARPYIVTEFVDGPQLDDYVSDVGPLGREGLVTLGHGLISALHAIHAVGVVHRDLKPGNVLLEGHRPVVIDFGIARLADDVRLTMTGLFIGTPGYVAPEVIYGDQATPATDWWAWAAVLAYAATGTAPSGKGPIEVVLDRIRRGELRLDGVDADLRPLLEDCLAVAPADRPSPAQIRDRFARYAAGGSTAVARRSPAPIPAPGRRDEASARTAVLPVVVDPGSPSDGATPARARPGGVAPDGVAPDRVAGPPPALRRPEEQPAERPPHRPRASRAREVAARRPVSTAGPVLACALLVVAASMSMPVAGAILLFLLLTTARTIDDFLTGLRWRAETSRTRRHALTIQLLTSPWAFAAAALRTLVTMILPVGIAAAGSYAAVHLIPAYLGWHAYNGNAAVGVGAVAAVTAIWIGPGGTAHRRSARRAVRAITPSPTASLALTGAILIAVAAIALVVWRYPVIDWTPLPAAPTRGL